MSSQKKTFKKIAQILVKAEKILFFTGAGVSTPSGIPDFRSPPHTWDKYDIDFSLWDKYDPNEYATIQAFRKNPKKIWNFINTLYESFENIKPNAAHNAITEIQSILGENRVYIVTQNIDQLHQKSGSSNVFEIHGSMDRIHCIWCHYSTQFDEKKHLDKDPYPTCPKCNNPLKPSIIFFGEYLPRDEFENALEIAKEVDVLFGVGTSLEVFPASELFSGIDSGVKVLFNFTLPNQRKLDYFVQGDVAETLPVLVEQINAIIEN